MFAHFTVANGVNQGEVTVPIVFNIYMATLRLTINSSGIDVI